MPIAEREPLRWIVTEERTAFSANRAKDARLLRKGDTVLLYSTRGCFNNPTRDRGRVTGRATVLAKAYTLAEPVRFGDRDFPIGVQLRIDLLAAPRDGVVLSELVSRFSASFPNASAWSAYLRRALVPLADEDATVLIDLLGLVAHPYAAMRDEYAAL